MHAPPRPPPKKSRVGLVVGVVAGLIALSFAGRWAKQRFVDPDRVLIGVHALSSDEAVVMYRYDRADPPEFRIARIEIEGDEPLWERRVGFPDTTPAGNSMSVAGGHAVVLEATSETQVTVTAHDLGTGEIAWQRELGQKKASQVVGRDGFVLVDGRDQLHLLDRAKGETIHEWAVEGHGQGGSYAFTDSWLEVQHAKALEYLEIDSGKQRRIEDAAGAHCRIDDRVYGFSGGGSLLAHDLSTGGTAEVMASAAHIDANHRFRGPDSCGWRNTPDGGLRLVFSRQIEGLVAIDLDPAAPRGSGTLAWNQTFDGFVESGAITYDAPNRLALALSGEVPRFLPLEIQLPDAPAKANTRLVVFDTVDGVVVRQSADGELTRCSSFQTGSTVFMALRGSESDPGYLIAMDGETGETRSVTSVGDLRVEPSAVAGPATWAWLNRSFSRQSNLAVTVVDHDLEVVAAGDPDRKPTPHESAIASIFGP